MIQVNDLKPGISFGYEKNIYVVLDIQHNKTAYWDTFTYNKL